MDAVAKRSQYANSPVAHLVACALDHDGAIIWNYGSGNLLVGEKANKVFRCLFIEIVLANQAAQRRIPRHVAQFAHQLTDTAAKLERTASAVSMPERHLAGLARRRRHQHPVVSDFVDPPGGGAQDEGVAGPAFKHHLLIEFPYPNRLALRT